MKIAVFIRNRKLLEDERYLSLNSDLKAEGAELYEVSESSGLEDGTDLILSVGGDGTFLSAAAVAADSAVPILGINLGRLGFLSENRTSQVAEMIFRGRYAVETRTLLRTEISGEGACLGECPYPYALNEVTVHRAGPAMLGVDISVDGNSLPTYWADGLLVATSSGSTAYSLSIGGPIVVPEAKVLIVAPISPHNLNLRPLVVPDTSVLDISLRARDEKVMLTIDNRSVEISPSASVRISKADFSLGRMSLEGSGFFSVLTSKLFWGEDLRNVNR